MVTDKRIGVLAGGTSAEREVSLRSGGAIYKALAGRGYNVVMIDASPDLCDQLKREKVDIAFMALHGGHGENGAVQGLLEIMGIPYTGSGVLASAMAMDKEVSKKIFLYHGVPVAPFKIVTSEELGVMSNGNRSPQLETKNLKLETAFDMPWVVKPVTEGSSIGVGIVRDRGALRAALESAFSYGEKILIEKYIQGKEIQIGIMGHRVLGGVEVRPSQEFYSYEAKYTAGLTQYILPPEVDGPTYEALKAEALKAHEALDCRGATRVDLILDPAGRAFVLEVNTLPGMTETSLLPKIARLSGLEFPDLVEEILKSATEKQ